MKLITKELPTSVEEVTDDGEVVAYLSTFENTDKVGDVIARGAFDDFIMSFDPEVTKLPMLYGHQNTKLIGEWVDLKVDDKGLIGRGVIYKETTQGADVHALLKRKALSAVSIGFRSNDYESLSSGGRQFNKVELVETSIVLNPCNPAAEILSVKSDDGLIAVSDLKSVLRNAGLNRAEIEALFNDGWVGIKQLRSSEEVEEKSEDIFNILNEFKF